MDMVDLTMGNPYVSTHVTRPFDGGTMFPMNILSSVWPV